MPKGKRCFPGRLTFEEWLETPSRLRIALIRRAQCDVLGSFRYCTDKRCKRGRRCVGADAVHCCWGKVKERKGKTRTKKRSARIEIDAFARLYRLLGV